MPDSVAAAAAVPGWPRATRKRQQDRTLRDDSQRSTRRLLV